FVGPSLLRISLRNRGTVNAYSFRWGLDQRRVRIGGTRSLLAKRILVQQIRTTRMAEIAQELGMASSTVSRALRGDPRISAEMRQRVETLAKNTGYRPNPLVSALMASRRRRGAGEVDVIALVTNYGGRESWRAKDVCRWEYEGIIARATALGFRVEIFPFAEYGGDANR